MDRAERRELVARNTAEVVTPEELDALLAGDSGDDSGDSDGGDGEPTVYIGYAPTGEMHIGHFTTIRKLADFLHAGLSVTVLIADLHAHLDDEKSPFELLDARSAYYRAAIEGMVEASGADPEEIEFVRGSEFELDPGYALDLLRLAADTTISRVQRAGSEVVRESENPKLGGLLYPLMQTLDVGALDADVAYGGIDQRGIYMLGRELAADRGEDPPICVFAPLLSGLSGGKMSASEAGSKVSLTDSPDAIAEKLRGAYCPAGEIEDNGVLEYLEYLVFPVLGERSETFGIERPEEYGGDVTYGSYDALEADFVAEELHPQDLKEATATHLAEVLAPIRQRFAGRPELLAEAYPEAHG